MMWLEAPTDVMAPHLADFTIVTIGWIIGLVMAKRGRDLRYHAGTAAILVAIRVVAAIYARSLDPTFDIVMRLWIGIACAIVVDGLVYALISVPLILPIVYQTVRARLA